MAMGLANLRITLKRHSNVALPKGRAAEEAADFDCQWTGREEARRGLGGGMAREARAKGSLERKGAWGGGESGAESGAELPLR